MDYSIIKKRIDKVFEDMGGGMAGGMVSAAAGLPGIESLPKERKKKIIKNIDESFKKTTVKKI